MNTDLSFLEVGRVWPPKCEVGRLGNYVLNRARFEGRSAEFSSDYYNSSGIRLNYFRMATLKLADLIGTPVVSSGLLRGEISADAFREDAVWDVVRESSLERLVVMAVYDMSRYGDALFRVGRGPSGLGRISLVRPDIWFPVVEPDDIGRFTHHVLAWVSEDEAAGSASRASFLPRWARFGAARQSLICEIHTPGFIEKRRYAMKNGRIGTLEYSEIVPTGLSNFAIIPVQNCVTSDRAFGQDDYAAIAPAVRELERRFGQIARVLDKHTEPTMQGPACALSRGDDGKLHIKTGEYLVNQEDGDENAGQVSYLTWDAKLDANFTFIDKLSSQIYALSEMGGALLGDVEARAGNLPSGSALRRLLFAPLNKAARVRAELDSALKKAIVLCCSCYGADLSETSVTIRWGDVLPADKLELAEIVHKRVGGEQTLSVLSAVRLLDGVDEEEAGAEIGRIYSKNAESLVGEK